MHLSEQQMHLLLASPLYWDRSRWYYFTNETAIWVKTAKLAPTAIACTDSPLLGGSQAWDTEVSDPQISPIQCRSDCCRHKDSLHWAYLWVAPIESIEAICSELVPRLNQYQNEVGPYQETIFKLKNRFLPRHFLQRKTKNDTRSEKPNCAA
jgi:hypothetical protein